ncbi:MAG: hypothetical protein K2G03_06270 [Bacilli bacterium]|nr:hypothetical protein [Bacilli bacterium]
MLAHEFDVDKAVYETFKVAESKRGLEDSFSHHAPIYLGPTGNTKDAVKFYTKDKKIDRALVVGSQGSFAYELALKNVLEIDCFDKNILQYLFFALSDAAIRNVDFKEFIYNFTSKKITQNEQRYEHILSDWIFFEVLDEMGRNEAEYWTKIYRSGKFHSLLGSELFRTYYPFFVETLRSLSSVYTKEGYERLQHLLNTNKVKINYHICDIDELHREFAGEKYELMMYGNILQYYNQIPSLDNVGAVNRYLKDKMTPMLTDNGQIQLCYGFEIVADAVKELLNIGEVEKPKDISEFSMRMGIESDKKNGYISNVIKKYGVGEDSPYSLEFIRAAEENDGHLKAKNVLLTYKPR